MSWCFPALKIFQLCVPRLVEFPEVDEGALPKLQTLDFTGCFIFWNLASLFGGPELLEELDFVGL